ncbi:MAG: FHA domain-containing protein, partial [Anaerolineae bacterium]|nr:FHA domain-containing protein [Anaerolineae bacterium]
GLPFRPVLTDLGLAKLAEGGMVTIEGSSMGTPAYMSPEQAIGEKTDARSDVYSLGILLYELAVGRLPFPVRTLTEAIRYHTKEPPPPPRSLRADLPEALEQVILKALDKDPGRRFASAASMAEALGRVLPAVGPAVTAVGAPAEGLMTVYDQSVSRPRGPSVLAEFPKARGEPTEDRITILLPDGSVRSLTLRAEELTIGRGADNGLVLDYGNVSRQHARIQFDGKDYKVTDLNSTNGTFLANVKLLPGVPEVWVADKALRIGDVWLRLERATRPAGAPVGAPAGTIATPRPPQGAQEPKRVAAFIGTPELSVEPGGSAAATVTILNQGTVVDHFQVSVTNLPAAWVPALPPLIRLLPNARQAVTLNIRPPRSPESRAGTYDFSIRVTSQDAPDQVAEVPARLTVAPYCQSQAELRPQSLAAGRPGRVAIENRGNSPQSYVVTWEDRGEELVFEPAKAQLTVPEGQAGAAEYRARARKRRLIGGRKSHAFTAKIAAAGGETHALNGEVVSRGLIPAWVPPLVIMPLIALCIAAAMLLFKPPVIESITIEPPEPLAGQRVTVRWVVHNADAVELRPLVSGLDAEDGRYVFSGGFSSSTSFTL